MTIADLARQFKLISYEDPPKFLTWIGLTSPTRNYNADFRWADGTFLDYKNWCENPADPGRLVNSVLGNTGRNSMGN